MNVRRPSGSGSPVAAAVVFGLIGSLALALGLRDALTARTVPYRLLGVLFTAAGMTLLFAAGCLARPEWRARVGRVAAVAACGAGVFVGGVLCFLQVTLPGPSEARRWGQFLLWLVIVVASVVACWLARVPTTAEERVGFGRAAGGLALAGVTGALVWGGVNWWYETQFARDAGTPALSVKASLKEEPPATGEASDMRVFRGTATVENKGGTRAEVVSSFYRVTREVAEAPKGTASTAEQEGTGAHDPNCFWWQFTPLQKSNCGTPRQKVGPDAPRAASVEDISRFSSSVPGAVIGYGQVVEDGSWFEPGEEHESTFLVRVPNNSHLDSDDLRLHVDLQVAKGARLALGASPRLEPRQIVPAAVSKEERRDIERVGERPGAASRVYPHRYVVSAWNIRPLSGVEDLLTGPPQVVNIIRTLQSRACSGDGDQRQASHHAAAGHHPCSEEYWDSPDSVVCTGSADDISDPLRDARSAYRDPTRICPLSGAPSRGALRDEAEKAAYYGMGRATAEDTVPLRPSAEQRASRGTTQDTEDPLPETSWPVPVSAEDSCGPAVRKADHILDAGKDISAALLEHKAIMDNVEAGLITFDQAFTLGKPSVKAGKEASASFDRERGDFDRAAARCENDSDNAVGGQTPGEEANLWKTYGQRVDAAREAVHHAADIRDDLNEHVRIMDQQLDLEQSMRPLMEGQMRAAQFTEALRRYEQTQR